MLMKDFIKFLILPFLVYLGTKYIHDSQLLHSSFNDPLTTIIEFAKYACFVFLTIYIVSETSGSYILPHLKTLLDDHIIPKLNDGLRLFSNDLLEAFKQKEFNIKPSVYVNNVEKDFLQLEGAIENPDEHLQKAYKLITDGKHDEAISLIETIEEKSQEHLDFLITQYITSSNKNCWLKAKELLDSHGKLKHYLRFAFTLWENNNINEAITISEQAYQYMERTDDFTVSERISCLNSLAYYYADGNVSDKSALATQSIKDVFEILKHAKDEKSIEYANALDTRGYINITFGDSAEDINNGINDCEKANSLGLDNFLLHRHLARAHARLAEIRD